MSFVIDYKSITQPYTPWNSLYYWKIVLESIYIDVLNNNKEHNKVI